MDNGESNVVKEDKTAGIELADVIYNEEDGLSYSHDIKAEVKTEEVDQLEECCGYICPMCDKYFDVVDYFVNHVKEHHGHSNPKEKDYPTDDANNSADNSSDPTLPSTAYTIKGSSVLSQGSDILVSKTDDRLFSSFQYSFPVAAQKSNCQGHSRNRMEHTGDIPFKGPEVDCSYTANRKDVLQTPAMTHTREKPLKCLTCSFTTVHKSSLKRHTKIHTGERPFKCCQCPFATSLKSDLQRHLTIHTGNKPFKCPDADCSFATTRKFNLQTHAMTHTNKKPFKCPEADCSYVANCKYDLKTHIMAHTDTKLFICPEADCSYTANRKYYLQTHVMTHTGEKPFRCLECSYATVHKSALRRHTMIHTGEKPFKCCECSYATSRKPDLQRHLKIMHPGRNHLNG